MVTTTTTTWPPGGTTGPACWARWWERARRPRSVWRPGWQSAAAPSRRPHRRSSLSNKLPHSHRLQTTTVRRRPVPWHLSLYTTPSNQHRCNMSANRPHPLATYSKPHPLATYSKPLLLSKSSISRHHRHLNDGAVYNCTRIHSSAGYGSRHK